MIGRILAILAILAFVIVPGLHAHGDADGACFACIHSAGAQAVIDAPPPVVTGLQAIRWHSAPQDAASLRPQLRIFQPRALSPPLDVA